MDSFLDTDPNSQPAGLPIYTERGANDLGGYIYTHLHLSEQQPMEMRSGAGSSYHPLSGIAPLILFRRCLQLTARNRNTLSEWSVKIQSRPPILSARMRTHLHICRSDQEIV